MSQYKSYNQDIFTAIRYFYFIKFMWLNNGLFTRWMTKVSKSTTFPRKMVNKRDCIVALRIAFKKKDSNSKKRIKKNKGFVKKSNWINSSSFKVSVSDKYWPTALRIFFLVLTHMHHTFYWNNNRQNKSGIKKKFMNIIIHIIKVIMLYPIIYKLSFSV